MSTEVLKTKATFEDVNPLFGDTRSLSEILRDEPAPAEAAPVEDAPALSDSDVKEIVDALAPAPVAETPKEPSIVAKTTLDADWDAFAKQHKLDVAAAQREALETLKKLTDADVKVREAALAELAKASGVQISSNSAQPTGNADNAELVALRNEIAALKAATQTEAQAKLSAEITSFSKQHEDFDTLRPEIAKVLKAGLASDLADAYSKVKAMRGEANAKPVHIKPSGSVSQSKPTKLNMFDGDVKSLRQSLLDSFKG